MAAKRRSSNKYFEWIRAERSSSSFNKKSFDCCDCLPVYVIITMRCQNGILIHSFSCFFFLFFILFLYFCHLSLWLGWWLLIITHRRSSTWRGTALCRRKRVNWHHSTDRKSNRAKRTTGGTSSCTYLHCLRPICADATLYGYSTTSL